jgi:DNA-binding response OmpR family regulator
MSVILLADDSPHAQRMGERILLEEGYRVVSVADGEAAIRRLAEVDPDLVIADAHLVGLSGLELCRRVKSSFQHVRVILTAGLLESLDEGAARIAGADAILRKPFEASVVMAAVHPLVEEARQAREKVPGQTSALNPEEVRAEVARVLEAELPKLIEQVTQRVLAARRR